VLVEAERVATVLRSLPDATLRATFLRDYLRTGDEATVARTLDSLCAAGARAEAAAREPMLAVVMTLAGLADDPALDRLGQAAAQLGLVSLARLLRRAPELPNDEVVLRTPDYGAGRELSLGERKALARRPNRAAFDKLLRDPHPLVVGQLLENPLLTEDDIVRLVARRPANPEAQRAVARTAWLCRPRVRMALIHNPGTPSAIAVPLLAACTRPELAEVRSSSECSLPVRETADDLFGLRSLPPPSIREDS
jgi:hypothetical protein